MLNIGFVVILFAPFTTPSILCPSQPGLRPEGWTSTSASPGPLPSGFLWGSACGRHQQEEEGGAGASGHALLPQPLQWPLFLVPALTGSVAPPPLLALQAVKLPACASPWVLPHPTLVPPTLPTSLSFHESHLRVPGP